MNFKIYKTKDYLTKKWSGGKTTELFIFPENSTYENLDFKFRLSSASIEAESSNFTILPNIKRKLFILDGSIKIKHDNSEYKILNKFDVDNFNGSEITTSLGKCIDFNLMSKNIKTGTINAIYLKTTEEQEFYFSEHIDFIFIYIFKGKVSVKVDTNKSILSKGELLTITDIKNFKISANKSSEIIITKIHL